jgi:hypothetical protein
MTERLIVEERGRTIAFTFDDMTADVFDALSGLPTAREIVSNSERKYVLVSSQVG